MRLGWMKGGIFEMNPVICPVCRTRTGLHLRDAEWYCMGVDYFDVDIQQVIE